MNSLLALSVLFVWGLSPVHGSLLELHKMITEVTGKNAIRYYAFYGCHCGVGGKGQPKDPTDRCCQLHDACYGQLLSHNCNAKTQHYHYSWHGGRPSCSKLDPGERGESPPTPPRPGLTPAPPLPAGSGSWCRQYSCDCDLSLALCLKRSSRSYSQRYRFYPKSWCW
ncbi:LOW QUALITY PROTEIN: basic phospholipase A2 sphenotoxin subunit B-like [Aegotheles albertisi]